MRSLVRRIVAVVVLTVVAMPVGGSGPAGSNGTTGDRATGGRVEPPTGASGTAIRRTVGDDTAKALARPTRLRIPAIGVDAEFDPLGLDAAGALEVPRDYGRVGWYAGGTWPGEVGPAVIAGHVDSFAGPAVFFRLLELRPRDVVQVARGGRWLTFRVVKIGRYAKTEFPTAAVYGPTPGPQLRLITCGGVFDEVRRSYEENVVVYAVG